MTKDEVSAVQFRCSVLEVTLKAVMAELTAADPDLAKKVKARVLADVTRHGPPGSPSAAATQQSHINAAGKLIG